MALALTSLDTNREVLDDDNDDNLVRGWNVALAMAADLLWILVLILADDDDDDDDGNDDDGGLNEKASTCGDVEAKNANVTARADKDGIVLLKE